MEKQKTNRSLKVFKWIGQYVALGIVTVFALYIARNFVGTKYEILMANVERSQLKSIVELLKSDSVPFMISVDKKRIRVPNYEIPRLKGKLQALLENNPREVIREGGY